MVQAMGRRRSHAPAPTKRRVVPLARKQPNRKCSCACGRPGRYLGRLEIDGEAHFLRYFASKQERIAVRENKRRELAEAVARAKLPKGQTITCDEWADRWVEKRERDGGKLSSIWTARQALGPFRERFGERPIGSIDDAEAEDWALAQRAYCLPPVVSLMNYAVRKRVIDHNPFAGIVRRGRGCRDQDPPTEEQFDALLLRARRSATTPNRCGRCCSWVPTRGCARASCTSCGGRTSTWSATGSRFRAASTAA